MKIMYEILLLAMSLAVIVLIYLYSRQNSRIKELQSSKQSLSTKYGQATEKFMPFMSSYPYDKNRFRFIGSPIDGVQFEDDNIIFMEFKTSSSRMTGRQRKIKDLIEKGKIKFEEFRI